MKQAAHPLFIKHGIRIGYFFLHIFQGLADDKYIAITAGCILHSAVNAEDIK